MVDIIHARGINDETWKNFKQAVIEKHGKLHGVLGKELTEALQLYLEASSQEEHTNLEKGENQQDKNELGIYTKGTEISRGSKT